VSVISGDTALAEFRGGLTGRRGLDLLGLYGGRVSIQLPVGVGKSVWIDAITLAAAKSGDYDLVVVLCPTRQLIEERAPLRDDSHGLRVVNLRPRPAHLCGKQRDNRWRRYEAADLGMLGRDEICGKCPHRRKCYWPHQYGKNLQKAAIIYATQKHLELSPAFLIHLASWAGADRTLTLLDESNFIGTAFDRVIRATDLAQFAAVLRAASAHCEKASWRHGDWLNAVEMLRDASTADLQYAKWRMPIPNPKWATTVQAAGLQLYDQEFRFLSYDLAVFCHSALESRLRAGNGDIQFSARPFIGDCMVFSATADAEFTAHRLGVDVASPFSDYRFIHPDTRWYNITSAIGARNYFKRHVPQVLDFFAELVARRAAEGKRVVLVAKKCFVEDCAEQLLQRWQARGVKLKPVTDNWTVKVLANQKVVPIINYGLVGTNLFENFDAVYCLTGYYVNEEVVNKCLQDVSRQDLRLPITIKTTGIPRRRHATVELLEHRFYDVAKFVQPALEFQELGPVIQAVGRVRPFTRPREVITFQMADLPSVTVDAEFSNLAGARRFFDISTHLAQRNASRSQQILELRKKGLTQAQTAKELGLSVRTVRNYERKENRQ
jgi:hypothetical protein